MKQRFTLLSLMLTLSMFFSLSASAYDVEVDGIYYNLIKKVKEAEVTSGNNEYQGDVVIPSTITVDGEEYTVTNIGDDAFFYCENITSIEIPSSVTEIGDRAFDYCVKLTSIVLPNTLTKLSDQIFSGCESLTSIELPKNLTAIGNSSFYGCKGLTSIEIPSSVTEIGVHAFEGCSSLISVNIPNTIEYVNREVFKNCESLTSIVIPSSVVFIFPGAFSGCKELADVYCHAVTLPETSPDAFHDSYIEYATLHVPAEAMNTYKTTEPWSSFGAFEALDDGTSVNTVKMRGVTIQSDGGFVTISGLDNGEQVRFFGVDGKMLGEARANDGTACFAATRGSVVIAKIGSDSVKIAVE